MAINYYIGEIAKKKGLFVFANQDDHYQPPIDSEILSDYAYGHNKLTLSPSVFNALKNQERKFTAREFVRAILKKNFVVENAEIENESNQMNFSLEPVAAVTIDLQGGKITLFENRKMSTMEKIKLWLASVPAYYWNIAKLQFKYWFADKEQKKEIAKELAKAKAYNLKP
jgi:hypothetical protein